jgi:dTDP-4-amino-4,6-dideoxygalactose transaminase
MKPLGCYGDGGAVFTNDDEWAELIRSYCVHGKGSMKYDNVRIGMNSRLDTIQAAVLLAKWNVFVNEELNRINQIADLYTSLLSRKLIGKIKLPLIREGAVSSWAQYTIKLEDTEHRDGLQKYLKEHGIPSFVYYPKPMHEQRAFDYLLDREAKDDFAVTKELSETVLSLPISPYMSNEELEEVVSTIEDYFIT